MINDLLSLPFPFSLSLPLPPLDCHYLLLLQPICLWWINRRQFSSFLAACLIPDHQSSAQHESKHQRGSRALEGITDHPVLVDAQQHQHQQCHIGRVLDFICERGKNVEIYTCKWQTCSTYDKVLMPWPARKRSPICPLCVCTILRVF